MLMHIFYAYKKHKKCFALFVNIHPNVTCLIMNSIGFAAYYSFPSILRALYSTLKVTSVMMLTPKEKSAMVKKLLYC